MDIDFDEFIEKLIKLKKEGKCTSIKIKIEYWDDYYDHHLLDGYFDLRQIKQ